MNQIDRDGELNPLIDGLPCERNSVWDMGVQANVTHFLKILEEFESLGISSYKILKYSLFTSQTGTYITLMGYLH